MMISDDHPIFESSRPSVELEKLKLKVLFVPNSDSSDTSEQWSIEGQLRHQNQKSAASSDTAWIDCPLFRRLPICGRDRGGREKRIIQSASSL
jgi:hypothetical protein